MRETETENERKILTHFSDRVPSMKVPVLGLGTVILANVGASAFPLPSSDHDYPLRDIRQEVFNYDAPLRLVYPAPLSPCTSSPPGEQSPRALSSFLCGRPSLRSSAVWASAVAGRYGRFTEDWANSRQLSTRNRNQQNDGKSAQPRAAIPTGGVRGDFEVCTASAVLSRKAPSVHYAAQFDSNNALSLPALERCSNAKTDRASPSCMPLRLN